LKISPFFSVKNVWKANNIFHCKLCWKIVICQPVQATNLPEGQHFLKLVCLYASAASCWNPSSSCSLLFPCEGYLPQYDLWHAAWRNRNFCHIGPRHAKAMSHQRNFSGRDITPTDDQCS
jgi:hypothetical protein